MDQSGDIARYIDKGLKLQGYTGMMGRDDLIVQDSDHATMLVWAKDQQARITIEVGSFGYPDDPT